MDFGTAGRLLAFLNSDRRYPAWPLLALSSRTGRRQPRQLSGVKRTPQNLAAAAANDPQETWRALIVFGAPG
jgi:hypothetical protein